MLPNLILFGKFFFQFQATPSHLFSEGGEKGGVFFRQGKGVSSRSCGLIFGYFQGFCDQKSHGYNSPFSCTLWNQYCCCYSLLCYFIAAFSKLFISQLITFTLCASNFLSPAPYQGKGQTAHGLEWLENTIPTP